MAAADSYFMNRLPKKLTDLDLGASGLVDRLRRASTTTKVAVCVSVAGGVLLLRRRRKGKPPAPQPTSYYCHEPPVKSFVTGADSALVRGMSSSGPGARDPETVPELLKRLETNTTKAVAWEENGAWRDLTWADYVSLVRQAARAMIAIGLEPRKGVGIIGFNSLEWVVADLGCVLAGGLAAGIYATNGADAARYVLDHSSAQLCFCDGAMQLEKIRKAAETLPKLKKIIVWGGADADKAARRSDALTWRGFLNNAPEDPAPLLERVDDAEPGHACTLIYTSGTTGTPKAVMISHDNVTWVVASFAAFVGFGKAPGGRERLVSYLPLSHIAAQAIDIYAGLVCTGRDGVQSSTLYFARPDALKGSLKDTLNAVRPTVFFGVPRVWEKFAEALQAVGAKTTGAKKKISTWAKRVALRRYLAGVAGAEPEDLGLVGGALSSVEEVFADLILKKVHAAIGLDKAHFVFTGAAPIATSTLEYFGSLGLIVNECFGMSEVSGPATVTMDSYYKPGWCGVASPGVEIRLEHVAGRDRDGEGEVCFRGRSVMLGYLRDAEKSLEAIDADGWQHSGDVGRFEVLQDGAAPMLKITGRIKERLVTAGGENVAPAPIEDDLKRRLPGVSTAVVIGDRLKFLSVLFTLKQRPNEDTFDDVLVGAAAAVNPEVTTAVEAADDATWRRTLQAAIDDYNKEKATSSAQRVQKFAILPLDFSQATGELTPTLKLKRATVVEKYADVLRRLYGDAQSAVWFP